MQGQVNMPLGGLIASSCGRSVRV